MKKTIPQLEKEIKLLKIKADKWDALDKKIASYYADDNGDELSDEDGGNLLDIGEAAAHAFGFI